MVFRTHAVSRYVRLTSLAYRKGNREGSIARLLLEKPLSCPVEVFNGEDWKTNTLMTAMLYPGRPGFLSTVAS